MAESTHKIAIIGAGGVGATIAYACLLRGVAKQIVLYDVNRAKVDAQVLDLNHGLQFVCPATVDGSDDIGQCADADVIVMTAGAKQKPGQTRMDLLTTNAALCKKLIPDLLRLAPGALLLLVTNPVDVVTYLCQKISGLPARRVLGSGTVLDSSRFRFLIAQRLKVSVQNVHATIAGEHGDSETPLWSSAAVGNVPLHEWAVMGHGKLSVRDRIDIFQNVKGSAQQIVTGKGATNYAIGLATARILEAILQNENALLPVSSLLTNYQPLGEKYDPADVLNDVCLSVPCLVNGTGVESALRVPMNDAEWAGVKRSAEVIRAAITSCGF